MPQSYSPLSTSVVFWSESQQQSWSIVPAMSRLVHASRGARLLASRHYCDGGHVKVPPDAFKIFSALRQQRLRLETTDTTRQRNAPEVQRVIDTLLAQNEWWVMHKKGADASFFTRLGTHAPKYLWIGCADARVPADVLLGEVSLAPAASTTRLAQRVRGRSRARSSCTGTLRTSWDKRTSTRRRFCSTRLRS